MQVIVIVIVIVVIVIVIVMQVIVIVDAGYSRCSAIVAAYLMLKKNYSATGV